MWIAVGIAVGMGLAALFLGIKYSLLKNCIRQAGQDMAEIVESPGENRILLAVCPSAEAEQLLGQVNSYIQYHQRERVRWQQQEHQLQEQIENISHDLRTPLTSILGYLELVDDSRLTVDDQEALAVVERKSRYLQELIHDFYDLTRLELADMRLGQEPVKITRLVRETMLSCYPEFEMRHLAVELALPETAVVLQGDQEAFKRILHNMIQNALRYAKSYFRICIYSTGNGPDRYVQDAMTGDTEGKRRICLEFYNDTDHITQEDIPCLFDRFYTADHARPTGSTGLGLTISRLLAEAMGGDVTAELTEQGELCLTFTFPPAWEQDVSQRPS